MFPNLPTHDHASRSPPINTDIPSSSSSLDENLEHGKFHEAIPTSFVPSFYRAFENAKSDSSVSAKRLCSPASLSKEDSSHTLITSSPSTSSNDSSSEDDTDKMYTLNRTHQYEDAIEALFRIPILDSRLESGYIGRQSSSCAQEAEMPFPIPDKSNYAISAEGSFTWSIPNFESLFKYKEISSPVFKLDDNSYWRILFFPRSGSSSDHHTNAMTSQISLYLMRVIPDVKVHPVNDTKTLCVQFSLALSIESSPEPILQRTNNHRFVGAASATSSPAPGYLDCQDWGYVSFISTAKFLRAFFDSQNKRDSESPLVNVIALIRTVNDPIGNLWIDPMTFDPRKECGYIGLRNQGATCYMNSLLQSLFMTTAFRRVLFSIPVSEGSKDSAKIPIALQRLFYALQVADSAVSTTELTQSFGWESIESFYQRDIQEFSSLLMDALERCMKGSPVEKAIDEIFRIDTLRYFSCLNVPYESKRVESFFDLVVVVKGMQSLERSLFSFIEPEFLLGDNRYNTDQYGLQDAKCGYLFSSLPPVLHFLLKRFEYDFERDRVYKINDRFEFPELLDMAPFMKGQDESLGESPSSAQTSKLVYRLHGVLVHSGDTGGGHYYAFIKSAPNEDNLWGNWLRFDDDNVFPVSSTDAIDDNFGGGTPQHTSATGSKTTMVKRFTSAYMLIYVLESRWMEMVGGVPSVPDHILSYFESSLSKSVLKEDNLLPLSEGQSVLKLFTDSITKEIPCQLLPGLSFEGDSATLVSKPSDFTLLDFARELELEYEIPSNCQLFYQIFADGPIEQIINLNEHTFGMLNQALIYLCCKPSYDGDALHITEETNMVVGGVNGNVSANICLAESDDLLRDQNLADHYQNHPHSYQSSRSPPIGSGSLVFLKRLTLWNYSFVGSMIITPNVPVKNLLQLHLDEEDIDDVVLIKETDLDAGKISALLDLEAPLKGEALRNGTILVLIGSSTLSNLKQLCSTLQFTVVLGDAMVEMGVDLTLFSDRVNTSIIIGQITSSLSMKNSISQYLSTIDQKLQDEYQATGVDLLVNHHEWKPLWDNWQNRSIEQLRAITYPTGLLERQAKEQSLICRVFYTDWSLQYRSGVAFPIGGSHPPLGSPLSEKGQLLFYFRPGFKELVRVFIPEETGTTNEKCNLKSYLDLLSQKRLYIKQALASGGTETHCLLDLLESDFSKRQTEHHQYHHDSVSNADTSKIVNSVKMIESVNGAIVRVLDAGDSLQVVGTLSQVYLTIVPENVPSVRILHTKTNNTKAAATIGNNNNSFTSNTRRQYFGIPMLFPLYANEPIDVTLKRISRLIPGITEFDVAPGKGCLKMYHIKPFTHHESDDEKGESIILSSNNLDSAFSLYDYCTSQEFDLSLDFLVLEHPERSSLPIKDIWNFSPLSQIEATIAPLSPRPTSHHPGDSMRIK